MSYSIRSLDKLAQSSEFDCGEEVLNNYLRRYASQDIKRNVARVFVISPAESPEIVMGFYTLSASSIAADTLPESLRKKLPRYPIPVALLGRLAINKSFQGKGVASLLLADACKRVLAASETLAVAAIIVDAKSPTAVSFYQHFGFVKLPGQEKRWMLPRAVFTQLV